MRARCASSSRRRRRRRRRQSSTSPCWTSNPWRWLRMLLSEKRIGAIREMVKRSPTEPLFRCRYDIYKRVLDYVIKASDEDELYGWLIEDFPAWTAVPCDNTSGDPVVLSPWQVRVDRRIDDVERALGLCARKVGKTTFVSAKTLHRAVRKDNAGKIVFVPTHGQDYMFRMIRKYVDMPWFKGHYIEPFSNTMNTATRIRLGNGSEIENRSIGVSSEGRWNLGEMGDGVIIDEVQETPRSIWAGVINPYLWDPFSRKDFIDMYPNAPFPPRSGRFYDRGIMNACVDRPPQVPLHFIRGSTVYPGDSKMPVPPGPNLHVVMAVDWAKAHDRTEILAGEIRGGHLYYLFWRRIYPTGVEYTAQVEYVKLVFAILRGHTLICDATSQQDVFIEMLTKGENAIPKARLWKDENAEEDRYGFRGSGVSNDFMHKNHKVALVNRMIHVPEQEPFLSDWIMQHNQLQAETTKNGLTGLRQPKNGFKDLAG